MFGFERQATNIVSFSIFIIISQSKRWIPIFPIYMYELMSNFWIRLEKCHRYYFSWSRIFPISFIHHHRNLSSFPVQIFNISSNACVGWHIQSNGNEKQCYQLRKCFILRIFTMNHFGSACYTHIFNLVNWHRFNFIIRFSCFIYFISFSFFSHFVDSLF